MNTIEGPFTQYREHEEEGNFLITGYTVPPKGIEMSNMLGGVDSLAGKVDAVNLVHLPSSTMRSSALSIALLLKDRGLGSQSLNGIENNSLL